MYLLDEADSPALSSVLSKILRMASCGPSICMREVYDASCTIQPCLAALTDGLNAFSVGCKAILYPHIFVIIMRFVCQMCVSSQDLFTVEDPGEQRICLLPKITHTVSFGGSLYAMMSSAASSYAFEAASSSFYVIWTHRPISQLELSREGATGRAWGYEKRLCV